MNSWLLHRAATSLLTIFLLVSAVFFIVRLAPGDPLDQIASYEYDVTGYWADPQVNKVERTYVSPGPP